MSSADKFLKKKEEITQAKLDKAQVEGALQQNLNRLKTDFGVSSLEAAKKKLTKLKSEDEELSNEIAEIEEELEEKYGD